MCDPVLIDFVSKDLERDSGILKQLRKAREEREFRSKRQGGGGKKDGE